MKTEIIERNVVFTPFTVQISIETKEELFHILDDFEEAINDGIDFGELLQFYNILKHINETLSEIKGRKGVTL